MFSEISLDYDDGESVHHSTNVMIQVHLTRLRSSRVKWVQKWVTIYRNRYYSCSVTASISFLRVVSPLQVTWKKFEEVHPLTIGLFPFAPDSRISVDYNQRTNEWSLIIQDIRPMDEGVYQCQISTKDDQDSYDITLNVKSKSNYMTCLNLVILTN